MNNPGRASALVVEIPAAEPAVGAFRDRLDPSARLGVPAHVTVLNPFAPAGVIGGAVRQQLVALFGAIPPFEGQFAEVVPHLTIGQAKPVAELRAAEEAVRAQLPIDSVAETVSLLTQDSGGRWQRRARFTLSVPEGRL